MACACVQQVQDGKIYLDLEKSYLTEGEPYSNGSSQLDIKLMRFQGSNEIRVILKSARFDFLFSTSGSGLSNISDGINGILRPLPFVYYRLDIRSNFLIGYLALCGHYTNSPHERHG